MESSLQNLERRLIQRMEAMSERSETERGLNSMEEMSRRFV